MDKEKAIKILNSKSSSKNDLREALAFALGVPVPELKDKTISLFTLCKLAFMNEYNKYTGLDYYFGAKDGFALSQLLKKFEKIDPENIEKLFLAYVQNLPDWYKKNGFSLTVINSKYNDIIAQIIKKTGANNGNSSAREAVQRAFGGENK